MKVLQAENHLLLSQEPDAGRTTRSVLHQQLTPAFPLSHRAGGGFSDRTAGAYGWEETHTESPAELSTHYNPDPSTMVLGTRLLWDRDTVQEDPLMAVQSDISHGGPPSRGCFSSGDFLALVVQQRLHGALFFWEDIAAAGLGEVD